MWAELDNTDNLVGGKPIRVFRNQKAWKDQYGTQHSRDWWSATSPEEKAAVHVYPIQEVKPPLGAGEHYDNPTYTFLDGVVTATYPVVDMGIERMRSEKIGELTRHAIMLRDNGFAHEGVAYASDAQSVAQIGLMFSASQGGSPFSQNFGIRTRDGSTKTPLTTPVARKAFADSMVKHMDDTNNAYDEHLTYLADPARTVAELKAYDVSSTITTAWPVVPEEV